MAEEKPDPLAAFEARRRDIRETMGGKQRIEKLHAQGLFTARERIDMLLDEGSFREMGTFTTAEAPEDRATTPGDGRITGFGTIAGRAAGVIADDATVKGASATPTSNRKADRIYRQALRAGHPLVYLGETRGSRLPDSLGSDGMSLISDEAVEWTRRARAIPLATVITGPSFGGSTFVAAMSDFVVQVKGTTLAVVSPRVIEMATGERTTLDALGGTELHATVTGQIDREAESEADAFALVRAFLSYLPQNADEPPPRVDAVAPRARLKPSQIVPADRYAPYDMHLLLGALVDSQSLFELKPRFGPSVITAFARLGGRPVAVIASNPLHGAGALEPDACDKATSLLCLADSFGLPVILIHDTPGFYVGEEYERRRVQSKTVMFLQALMQFTGPRLSLIVRKSFGLAFTSLGGTGTGVDFFAAWPASEIGFMDPHVAANAMHGDELAALGPTERRTRRAELAAYYGRDTDPYAIARTMALDEIIHPDETRAVLLDQLERLSTVPRPTGGSPLRHWPTCW
ncbi:acyl-CoA carboxylase subunit beta [Acuticoccus kandeliae]|uniref:acyl-CoA carboxylase subunit beta n=1 Tax=Acuticoccus kandeliae TaxID=2073160 RepID=UPI000D3EAFF1|nr:carboxyl transferase domain-containing protein [Acuticoccus kandeliae]